jgi:hypothetical protein
MSGQISRARVFPLAVALSLAFAAVSACNLQLSTDVEAKDTWTRSYPITATGSLHITNSNGRISIEAADTEAIEITAERIVKASTEEAANEQLALIDMQEQVSDDRVSLDSSTRGLTINVSRRINYTVRVPKTLAVTLRSSNGDIVATGLTGAFSASSSNGRITGVDLAGSADASTTNGVIALTMTAIEDAGVSAETTNGTVTVTIPRDTNATFTARVTNGAISHENLDLIVSESSRRRLDGRLGSGGPTIRIETTNGAVRLIGR